MEQIPEQLYRQLKKISIEVKEDLKRKGIAIPVKNSDGSITVGLYTVQKRGKQYQIRDYSGEIIIDQVNLPHSAIILANNLALGKFIDKDTLRLDRFYGYAAFEEELHKKSAERNIKNNADRADVAYTKSAVNKSKKDRARAEIIKTFEKLKKFA